MERRRKTRPSKFVNYNRLPLLIAPLYLSFWLQLGDHPICRGMNGKKKERAIVGWSTTTTTIISAEIVYIDSVMSTWDDDDDEDII